MHCRECIGTGMIVSGRIATECHICTPKARTYMYLKDSGMSIEDIQKAQLDRQYVSLLDHKVISLQTQVSTMREEVGFALLKEEAKRGRSVQFVQLPSLIAELKRGNKEIIRYDTLFIDSLDIYGTIDQYVLPWYDGLIFAVKNDPKKRLIVGCQMLSEGYSGRLLELCGPTIHVRFLP